MDNLFEVRIEFFFLFLEIKTQSCQILNSFLLHVNAISFILISISKHQPFVSWALWAKPLLHELEFFFGSLSYTWAIGQNHITWVECLYGLVAQIHITIVDFLYWPMGPKFNLDLYHRFGPWKPYHMSDMFVWASGPNPYHISES